MKILSWPGESIAQIRRVHIFRAFTVFQTCIIPALCGTVIRIYRVNEFRTYLANLTGKLRCGQTWEYNFTGKRTRIW